MNVPPAALNAFLVLCRMWVFVFVILFTIFGQLFVGSFLLGASLSAITAFVVVFFGSYLTRRSKAGAWLVVTLCAVGVLGVGVDAYTYYTQYDVPGNDFAGSLRVITVTPLLFLSIPAFQRILKSES